MSKDTLYPCSDSAAGSLLFGVTAVLTHSSRQQKPIVGTYRTVRFLSFRTGAHRARKAIATGRYAPAPGRPAPRPGPLRLAVQCSCRAERGVLGLVCSY